MRRGRGEGGQDERAEEQEDAPDAQVARRIGRVPDEVADAVEVVDRWSQTSRSSAVSEYGTGGGSVPVSVALLNQRYQRRYVSLRSCGVMRLA